MWTLAKFRQQILIIHFVFFVNVCFSRPRCITVIDNVISEKVVSEHGLRIPLSHLEAVHKVSMEGEAPREMERGVPEKGGLLSEHRPERSGV